MAGSAIASPNPLAMRRLRLALKVGLGKGSHAHALCTVAPAKPGRAEGKTHEPPRPINPAADRAVRHDDDRLGEQPQEAEASEGDDERDHSAALPDS